MASSASPASPGGNKNVMLDELHHNFKAASIKADSFAQQQSGVQTALIAHEQELSSLRSAMITMEQQVRGIARVMASQNVQKLTENMKLAQDDLQRSLHDYVNEKLKDVMHYVEREVGDVTDAKSGLGKKIDNVEAHIMGVVTSKLEEAAQMRHTIKDELERVRDMMENVPAIADKNSKLLRQMETRINDMKNDFRNFEREHERANLEQDKDVAALKSEIRSALEGAKDKLSEESKTLQKSIRKHEAMMDDKLKSLADTLEKECKDRSEQLKGFPAMVQDTVGQSKQDFERKFHALEVEMDRKVRPFVSSVQELRHLIDEEKVHREAQDSEICRSLNKEIASRNHDEERLLSLISVCQNALTKMHKS
eukprot:TRINITY_DN4255_c0_g1_i2.p1 TRINITY_DN4255_c0_g1~~TRINITY_DN4255_c0_g1_i2.p1  ORF type:complete len:367 (-),score=116.53 TRINITY_DN4255_c0_g1_i2:151-1251(-)